MRYICYGKTRKQTECDGQTGYTAHIFDGIIDKLVRRIFERMNAMPRNEIINIRYREKMKERENLLYAIRREYIKATSDLDMQKAEVLKTLRRENAFTQELLSALIAETEAKCRQLKSQLEEAQASFDEGKDILALLNAQYDDIISWLEMYDSAGIEAKKMIIHYLMKRVEVYRGYKLQIDFEQFGLGIAETIPGDS